MAPDSLSPRIKVIAGLGNPGKAYAQTRHNIGFMVVDSLVEQLGWKWKKSLRFRGQWCNGTWRDNEMYFIKPHTFMNASGRSLQSILKYLKLAGSHLMCVYDDITLPTGKLKLSIGGGDGGHNGIKDIQRMNGNDFTRFRIGVGQKLHAEMDLKDHVLSRFSPEEETLITAQLEFYRNSIGQIVEKGPVLAMNTINQK
jgi:peptidyl-tRNA hydrolase, PTH1 family